MNTTNIKLSIRKVAFLFGSMFLITILFSSCTDDDSTTFSINDEPQTAIGFNNTDVNAEEGTQTATFEIKASKPVFSDTSFELEVTSGNANEVTLADKDGNTGTSFSIKAGEETTTITVTVSDDDTFTGNRTIGYKLINLSGDNVFLPEDNIGSGDRKLSLEFTLTIVEDEPSPTAITFKASESSVDENAGATQSITIQLTEAAPSAGSFDIQLSGTAVEGTNFNSNANAGVINVTINANDTQFTVDITPIDNANAEGNKTVILTLTNPANGFVIGTNTQHTLTIVDDDLPRVTLTPEADCGIRGGDKGDDTAAGGVFARAANGTDERGRDERQMMFRFDISGIDLSKVRTATLKLTTVGADRTWGDAETNNGGNPTTQKIYHVTGDDNWDEVNVTWNTAPAFNPTPIATGSFGIIGTTVVSHEYDVKDALVIDADGKFSIRLGIDDDTDGKSVFYQTRESTAGGVPELIIVSDL